MNRLTEEYEEVLGADAFPHRARGKAGRPLSTDKKIQMKLYSTEDNKENLEYMARQYEMCIRDRSTIAFRRRKQKNGVCIYI